MINNTYLEMQLAQNIPDSQHLFNIQKYAICLTRLVQV